VTFKVKFKTDFGQRLWLVGDHPQLGSWDCSNWIKMKWSQGDMWTADVAFEQHGGAATQCAYKVSHIAAQLLAGHCNRCRCMCCAWSVDQHARCGV